MLCVGDPELGPRKLILCDLDHLLREIDTDDFGAGPGIARCEDAGTASDVENLFTGSYEVRFGDELVALLRERNESRLIDRGTSVPRCPLVGCNLVGIEWWHD